MHEIGTVEAMVRAALSEEEVNEVGRRTGQSKRMRVITPFRLFSSIVGSFSSTGIESLADLLRGFNHRFDTSTAYKAFYNRIAQPQFPEFMREMLCRLLTELAMRSLKPAPGSPTADFEDIIIQDGSSLCLKAILNRVFPGRFSKTRPAGIELHATYSGFEDNVIEISLAPDKEPEPQFLPAPPTLRGKLLLADRGYPSTEYFQQLKDAGAFFVVRATKSYDPYVVASFANGKRRKPRTRVRLAEFLALNKDRLLDLDVEFERGDRRLSFRFVIFPSKDKFMTRLVTNLDREKFPTELVGHLYRFRWQVELCFKEWKSYANLHRFDTGNEHIAEGLAWASLCAAVLKRFLAHATQNVARISISTRKVAMCAGHLLDDIFAALHRDRRGLRSALVAAIDFLRVNAKRSHPMRDLKSGRLRGGFVDCFDGAAK
jgi:hypothetical protein